MAKEKKAQALEREYIIPLRRYWLRTVMHKRTNRAVRAIREFIGQHMKSDNVKIGPGLNNYMWMHSIKSPPHKVKVTAKKADDKVVVELHGYKPKVVESKAPVKKAEEKKTEKAKEEVKETPKVETSSEKPKAKKAPAKKEA